MLYILGLSLCLCYVTAMNIHHNCGWKNPSRIVGGEETGVNEYPMMAGLVDIQARMIFCGATIISTNYLLTAAHCVENRYLSDIAISVGEHDVSTGRETNATRIYIVSKKIIHPDYNGSVDNDIAIIEIMNQIVYTNKVGPACLPFEHKADEFDNVKVVALGWGLLEFAGAKSNTLQKVDLNIIPFSNCTEFHPNISHSQMCTYTPGKDTCQMDSGGPLLWHDPRISKIVLIGIIGSGIGCASNEPSISLRVGAYIDWIVQKTSDAQYNLKIE